jgi:flavin reductase (DIM6/NTAB) family NADH-FMN oxidoreductase RutF
MLGRRPARVKQCRLRVAVFFDFSARDDEHRCVRQQLSTPDDVELRRVLGCFPTGVTAFCASVDGAKFGLTVSSFSSVSLDPPLVAVCVRDISVTWKNMRRAERLGISVLAASQALTCRQLAGHPAERFRELPVVHSERGAVFIVGAVAWLECAIEKEILAGDHYLVLLRVHGVVAEPERSPLLVHRSRLQPPDA